MKSNFRCQLTAKSRGCQRSPLKLSKAFGKTAPLIIGNRANWALLLLACVPCFVGCTEKEVSRVAVAGSITYAGEPVQQGQIVFEPCHNGRMGIGQIVGGSYSIPPEHGPSPGEYLVRITAARPTGEMSDAGTLATDSTQREVFEQFLPTKYNDHSELTVEIEPITSVEHNFDLVSD